MSRTTVSTAALATLTTGICMVQRFEGVYEAAEAVMGYPVFTHELPDAQARMQELVRAQLPDFPMDVPKGKRWDEARDEAILRYGVRLEIEQGIETRTEGPLSSLARKIGGGK